MKNNEVDHSVAVVAAATVGGLLAIPFVGVAPLIVVLIGIKVAYSVVEEMTNNGHKAHYGRRKKRR